MVNIRIPIAAFRGGEWAEGDFAKVRSVWTVDTNLVIGFWVSVFFASILLINRTKECRIPPFKKITLLKPKFDLYSSNMLLTMNCVLK